MATEAGITSGRGAGRLAAFKPGAWTGRTSASAASAKTSGVFACTVIRVRKTLAIEPDVRNPTTPKTSVRQTAVRTTKSFIENIPSAKSVHAASPGHQPG